MPLANHEGMIMDWPIVVTVGILLLVLALVLLSAWSARSQGGRGGDPGRRGDFRKGTTYEQPQDEGAPQVSRVKQRRGRPRRH